MVQSWNGEQLGKITQESSFILNYGAALKKGGKRNQRERTKIYSNLCLHFQCNVINFMENADMVNYISLTLSEKSIFP